jgi:hypothetical protein
VTADQCGGQLREPTESFWQTWRRFPPFSVTNSLGDLTIPGRPLGHPALAGSAPRQEARRAWLPWPAALVAPRASRPRRSGRPGPVRSAARAPQCAGRRAATSDQGAGVLGRRSSPAVGLAQVVQSRLGRRRMPRVRSGPAGRGNPARRASSRSLRLQLKRPSGSAASASAERQPVLFSRCSAHGFLRPTAARPGGGSSAASASRCGPPPAAPVAVWPGQDRSIRWRRPRRRQPAFDQRRPRSTAPEGPQRHAARPRP